MLRLSVLGDPHRDCRRKGCDLLVWNSATIGASSPLIYSAMKGWLEGGARAFRPAQPQMEGW